MTEREWLAEKIEKCLREYSNADEVDITIEHRYRDTLWVKTFDWFAERENEAFVITVMEA